MFIQTADYKQLITSDDLEVVQQADTVARVAAENAAIEYFKGYLRSRYNVVALFALTGAARDPVLLQFVMDEVLYTLHSTLPGNMMPEIRQIRKENLDKWLMNVQKGLIEPNFPTIDGDDDSGNPVKYGGNKKLGSTW
ncbi:MAG: hypothetical protein Q8O72_10575 [Bacteroidales bacterium]|nr:hypothetical protein [Bacteroidales bacterium]